MGVVVRFFSLETHTNKIDDFLLDYSSVIDFPAFGKPIEQCYRSDPSVVASFGISKKVS